MMMNCDDYKEAIAADPAFDGGVGHVTECASCQAYRKEMLALNDRIASALAIDVPELVMPELPVVETDKVVTLADRRRVSPPVWFAVAASVVTDTSDRNFPNRSWNLSLPPSIWSDLLKNPRTFLYWT